ncbi:MAG: alpha-L-fucosidase [Lentisphaeria bacterium]|nr:alpha-L-fucosidase [Lentisphaeria bacterium]
MSFPFGDARDWFGRARFGMFVHWGLYALDGWHEQQHYRQRLSRGEYRALAARFDPRGFSPQAWLDLAQACGMRYLVVTAKHIDGFCLFHSRVSDFTVEHTPHGRDLIAQIAEACHRRAFPFGVYFSALDNLHPCYPRAGRAHESEPEPGDTPDLERYMDFVRAQVRELCTNYGALRVFWWDANRTGFEDRAINDTIRRLQPACVINDRGWDEGDFGTPERDYQAAADAVTPFPRRTEACDSVGSQSWGYRSDEDYFTPRYLMGRIDLMMAKGANYLLNVGPDPLGRIPAEQERILRTVGRWHRRVAEAFHDTGLAPELSSNRDVLLTRRANTVYVHLNPTPRSTAVVLRPLNALPAAAVLLNTGETVACDLNRLPALHREPVPTCLRLHSLPVERLAGEVPVIRLEFGAGLPAGGPSGTEAGADLANR